MSDTCHRRINLGCSNRKIISCLERSINVKKSSKLYPGRVWTPTKKRRNNWWKSKMVKKGINRLRPCHCKNTTRWGWLSRALSILQIIIHCTHHLSSHWLTAYSKFQRNLKSSEYSRISCEPPPIMQRFIGDLREAVAYENRQKGAFFLPETSTFDKIISCKQILIYL